MTAEAIASIIDEASPDCDEQEIAEVLAFMGCPDNSTIRKAAELYVEDGRRFSEANSGALRQCWLWEASRTKEEGRVEQSLPMLGIEIELALRGERIDDHYSKGQPWGRA